jgi:hypothetical protein
MIMFHDSSIFEVAKVLVFPLLEVATARRINLHSWMMNFLIVQSSILKVTPEPYIMERTFVEVSIGISRCAGGVDTNVVSTATRTNN